MADPAAARKARTLIRSIQKGALSTVLASFEGWPYGSLVLVANDYDASPILLISDLAEHAKNIAEDARVSLLFDGTSRRGADPLDGPRVSVLGRAQKSETPHLRARYLARHPAAARFSGFGDFCIYRFEVERAYLVEGFGRVRWFEPAALLFDGPASAQLADAESDILGPSEAFRKEMDYFSHTRNAVALFEKLAAEEPTTLACMHGSAWKGDAAALLRELSKRLGD